MTLLSGNEILTAVKSICKANTECYLAVSYWSGGAAKAMSILNNKNAHVVLDVNSGGTSASELVTLMKHLGNRVKVHPDLHTKIYASRESAIVGSANASRLGLQLKPTARQEAAVELNGKDAAKAFDHAKNLFKQATVASQKHVDICNQRFGRKTLAESEAGRIEKLDLLSALKKQPDLYAHLPVILTDSEFHAEKDWAKQRLDLVPDKKDPPYDSDEWDAYEFRLPAEYSNRICLALHVDSAKTVWVSLVRPQPKPEYKVTFARYLEWNEISGLKYQKKGPRRIKPVKDINILRVAIERVLKIKRRVVYVSDLICELKRP